MLKCLLSPSSVFVIGLALSQTGWTQGPITITLPSGGGSRATADTTPEIKVKVDNDGVFDEKPIAEALACVAPQTMVCKPKKFTQDGGSERQTIVCKCE